MNYLNAPEFGLSYEPPQFPYHPFVGHTAGSLRWTWSYGDSILVCSAQMPFFDLKSETCPRAIIAMKPLLGADLPEIKADVVVMV